MRRAKYVASIALLSLLSACSASMVNAPGTQSPSTYAPINEQSRAGLIKYLNEGAANVIAKRREDAYRQMFTACGGRYNINAEGPESEGAIVTPLDSYGMVITQSQHWYIQFSCEPS